jgi:hypothetical protein
MIANKYILQKEHLALLIFAFAAFVFVLSGFASEFIKSHNTSGSLFPYYPTYPAGLHFLTFFIFIALLKTKRYLLPLFLTVFYAVVFVYGLSMRYDGARLGGEEFSPKVDFLDKVYRAATDYDYIVALFISILLFWQISILLRMLIKTSQKENVLP